VPKTKKKEAKETPLMGQYNKIKTEYPGALLLFRVGDFYETFGEDAIIAAKVLGIVLTSRNNGGSKVELAGFPHHSLETYLPKLVRAGYRVAICDQLEDPKATKKIVKRGVTEVVTPGVAFNDKVLDHKKNNFLAAIHFDKGDSGVAFLDISTGEFLVAQGNLEYVEKLIQSFQPNEIVFQKQKTSLYDDTFSDQFYSFRLDDWIFEFDYAEELLHKHFEVNSFKGFGIEKQKKGIIAAGAALQYVLNNQHKELSHVNKISRIDEDKYVWIDRFTARNLELLYSPHPDAKTLVDVIDHTCTPMGGRLLKRWISLPIKNINEINQRLSCVEGFIQDKDLTKKIISELKSMGDLERLVGKVASRRINPREILQLKKALHSISDIHLVCAQSKSKEIKSIAEQLNLCSSILQRLEKEVLPDAPMILSKGETIAPLVNTELDDLRNIRNNGKAYLADMLERETERTGIPSLKIAHNNVFGYYLEVRNSHKDKVPEEWIRKQTLTQAERYITQELKEYEAKILGAEEKILAIETQLFSEIVLAVSEFCGPLQINSNVIAKLDCLVGFSELAIKNRYHKPELNDSKILEIKDGRHPVIEQNLKNGEQYIANDLYLDPDSKQIMMITGPNMSGKSALLRQTALIVLLAQIGCYVPAASAKIGWTDKIFTRVGASDNISSGESTFMVEMNETASILNNLSDRSLILLDEIGRGTSTYDGISIAWSIAKFIHDHPNKAKTMFATHYHELNDMSNDFPRIKNHSVSVKESGKKVIFLRKLIEGGSEHSFGIHVAKMAGMPNLVVKDAEKILKSLEAKSARKNGERKELKTGSDPISEEMQLSFFQLDDPILEDIRSEIEGLDINTLTPVEALMKLNEIKKMVGKG
jgi:DNA mismatch repair protein MutS